MFKNLLPVLLASAVAGCATAPDGQPFADRGVEAVNQPVLTRANYVMDVAAPGGVLPPEEFGRLDGWFRGLNLGYGDSIHVDGGYAGAAASQIAELAGRYGMMVGAAAPVTAGAVPQGSVRVIVSRNRAEVPNCPNWSRASQPNYENRSLPGYGCSVNSNLTAMVANPEDLFYGREGPAAVDVNSAAKAVKLYRQTPPTGSQGLQDINTKGGQ